MIQVKHIKKVTSFLLILVTALLLVACSKKENVPYGNIDLNSNYLSVGSDNVTEKEVYDTLRRQSGSVLPKLIEEKLFESYKEKANNLLKVENPEEDTEAFWAQEEFDKIVNAKIFSTNDVESIEKMQDLRRKTAIAKYVDGIFDNAKVSKSRSEFVDLINDFIVEGSETYATGYSKEKVFVDLYINEIQKMLFAKEQLAKDIIDEDSSNYIKEKDVVSYYKNNIKKQLDVNAFFFPFLSTNEANAALRSVGIKSNSRGNWFEIPDIRLVSKYNEVKDETDDYIWKVIKEVKLEEKFRLINEDATLTKVTNSDYKKFYEAFSPTENNSTAMPAIEVLAKFVEAYNLVNSTANQLEEIDTAKDVLGYELEYKKRVGDDKVFQTEFTYDEITEVSTTLRNYIYDSLTEEKPFSTLRSIGNLRYLVFKLDENYQELNFVSEEKDEDDNEKFVKASEIKELLADEENNADILAALTLINDELAEDKKFLSGQTLDETKFDNYVESKVTEWSLALVDTKLTASYVTSKVNALYEDEKTKVEIYDDIMAVFFNQSAKVEAKYKNAKNNTDLLKATFKVNDNDVEIIITADEYYALLEPQAGLETALDLLLNKLLVKEYKDKNGMFKDDKIVEKDFKKEFKEMINGFSSDQFAQAGYPASMGREAFMLLLFGSRDQNEAIELGYLVPKLRELFLSKEEIHISSEVNLNQVFATYAEKQYNEFKGVQVSHLLVYFDENGDGSPDKPSEYLEKLSATDKEELLELIVTLQENVVDLLGYQGYDDLSNEKFNAIVSKFEDSARLPLDTYYEDLGDKFQWIQIMRKFGLKIKFENLSSEITNTSNFITGSSTLDQVFYDRALALRDLVEGIKGDDEDTEYKDLLPYFDFGGSLNKIDKSEVSENFKNLTVEILEDELMSDFGFHFILVDSISEKTSAKFESKDDSNDKYVDEDDKTLNAYNDNEVLSETQIKYYLKNKDNSEGVLLPSNVRTAINKYFDPVYNIYTNNNTKNHLVYKYLNDLELTIKDSAKAKFNDIIEINISTIHSYLNGGVEGSFDEPNYMALYGDLLKDLGLSINTK